MSGGNPLDLSPRSPSDIEQLVEQAQLEITSRCEATAKRRAIEEARARAEGISVAELHGRAVS